MQETEDNYFQLRPNNFKQPRSQSQEQQAHISSGQQSINITTAHSSLQQLSEANRPTLDYQRETDAPQTYRVENLTPTTHGYDNKIIKISARKREKTVTLFRAHFSDESKPKWVEISRIPPKILAAYYVNRYRKRNKYR
jgi:hypothetical protein